MSALQKWKIRILSFEKQLLSKNLLSNNVLQPQMQFDSNCHNNTNAVKANRTFQMGKNKNECKEIGLKQYQWPINPSSSTHRFRQEELSDDDDDDADNSFSSGIIEAIQNAIENQSNSDEIVTNVINYKDANDVHPPKGVERRGNIQGEPIDTHQIEAPLKVSAQPNKTQYKIFTTPTADTRSTAVSSTVANDPSEPHVLGNVLIAAKQISLLEDTKINIIHLIDQQLTKLQSQRTRSQLVSVRDAGDDGLGKLMNATEFKKRSLRKDSIRKIREQVDIIEDLENC